MTPNTDELSSVLGVIVAPELFELALTHRSFAYENGGLAHNERLEFLGDSILGQAVTVMLYTENPQLDEGELAKRRASLVSSVALAEVARSIGLGAYIRLGRGEELTGGRDKSSILADTLEALIGATYLDLGGEAATTLVLASDPPATGEPGPFRRIHGSEDEPAGACGPARARATELPGLGQRSGSLEAFSRHRAAGRRPDRVWRWLQQEARGDGGRAPGLDAAADSHALTVPELPEVEVVRAGLEPAVTGARVHSVTIFDERSLRRHDGPAEDFIERLTGRTMLAPQRRGKFMWIPLDGGSEALVTHLGMSGQVLLRDTATDDARTRIRVDVRHPVHGSLRLNFVDQRIFGSMAIDDLVPSVDGGDTVPSKVAHIARDPLDALFNDALFLSRLSRKNTTIKRAMLDQTLISGIGNIYADEALWAARVHYDQPTATLSRARAKVLLAEVRLVLLKALAEGGTSFDAQYLNVNGQSGYFAHSLNAYGQQGKPCQRCGRPIIRESFMNRGSHFCAHCQRVR